MIQDFAPVGSLSISINHAQIRNDMLHVVLGERRPGSCFVCKVDRAAYPLAVSKVRTSRLPGNIVRVVVIGCPLIEAKAECPQGINEGPLSADFVAKVG
jgi:hypothetical protein